jgi:hypothetical protein
MCYAKDGCNNFGFQEGVLAQKLIFEFSNGSVALEELLPMGKERFNPMLANLSKEVFQLTKQ